MITDRKKSKKDEGAQVGVRIDLGLKRELETIAQEEDRTIAQVARMAIKQFVERRKSQVAA